MPALSALRDETVTGHLPTSSTSAGTGRPNPSPPCLVYRSMRASALPPAPSTISRGLAAGELATSHAPPTTNTVSAGASTRARPRRPCGTQDQHATRWVPDTLSDKPPLRAGHALLPSTRRRCRLGEGAASHHPTCRVAPLVPRPTRLLNPPLLHSATFRVELVSVWLPGMSFPAQHPPSFPLEEGMHEGANPRSGPPSPPGTGPSECTASSPALAVLGQDKRHRAKERAGLSQPSWGPGPSDERGNESHQGSHTRDRTNRTVRSM